MHYYSRIKRNQLFICATINDTPKYAEWKMSFQQNTSCIAHSNATYMQFLKRQIVMENRQMVSRSSKSVGGGRAVILKAGCERILWGDGTTSYPDDYRALYMC